MKLQSLEAYRWKERVDGGIKKHQAAQAELEDASYMRMGVTFLNGYVRMRRILHGSPKC